LPIKLTGGFHPNSTILSRNGEVSSASLRVGVELLTEDHGFQPLRWVQTEVAPANLDLSWVRIEVGALGNRTTLRVVDDQYIAISGALISLHFGVEEVLALARHLVNDTTIKRCPAPASHPIRFSLDRPELVYVNALKCESHFVEEVAQPLDREAEPEIFAMSSSDIVLATPQIQHARPCLYKYEAGLVAKILGQ